MNTAKIYTCKTFTGHWPVGTAAVVIAKNQIEAADKLNAALKEVGLKGDAEPSEMVLFPLGPNDDVRILNDGNY